MPPRAVARWRCSCFLPRGLNWEEIVKTPPEGRDPVVDPETAKPCSIGTIDGGVRAPLAEWKEQAARNTETLKGGKHPAGAREAKKCAAAC